MKYSTYDSLKIDFCPPLLLLCGYHDSIRFNFSNLIQFIISCPVLFQLSSCPLPLPPLDSFMSDTNRGKFSIFLGIRWEVMGRCALCHFSAIFLLIVFGVVFSCHAMLTYKFLK